jgi:hypothetical protein
MIIKRTLFVRRLLYGYFSTAATVSSAESANEPVVKKTTVFLVHERLSSSHTLAGANPATRR